MLGPLWRFQTKTYARSKGSGGGGAGGGEDEEESCAICLMEFEGGGEEAKELGCGHCYHAECLDQWLQRSSVCPLCKRQARSG